MNINSFRESLKTGLSEELVRSIVTKFLNADLSTITTYNGSKMNEVFKYALDNKAEVDTKEFADFLNHQIKEYDYLQARDAYIPTYMQTDDAKRRETMAQASKVLRNSLYDSTRPETISLRSAAILNRPQRDESMHLLTINTNGKDIVSVVKAIYSILRDREIPFDIEVPKTPNLGNGYTEPIKLHVTTADLEHTIKAIKSLDKVYRDKIKPPTLMTANIDDIIGYDSYLFTNGERTSTKLGVVIIKAIDRTIAKLGEGLTLDGLSLIDYLKQAENQDRARKLCLEEIMKVNPDYMNTILISAAEIIKEDKIELNPDNVFLSEIAAGELNAEYGALDEPEEIVNKNEIEYEDEVEVEKKDAPVAPETTEEPEESYKEKNAKKKSRLAAAIDAVKALLADKYIQPAITFGQKALDAVAEEAAAIDRANEEAQAAVVAEPTEEVPASVPTSVEEDSIASLQVENPQVTVVEPIKKEQVEVAVDPELSEEERMDKLLQDMNAEMERIQVERAAENSLPAETPTESTPAPEEVAAQVSAPASVAETTPVEDVAAPVETEVAPEPTQAPEVTEEPKTSSMGTVETRDGHQIIMPEFLVKYHQERLEKLAKAKAAVEATAVGSVPVAVPVAAPEAAPEVTGPTTSPTAYRTTVDGRKMEIPDFLKKVQDKNKILTLPGEEELTPVEETETKVEAAQTESISAEPVSAPAPEEVAAPVSAPAPVAETTPVEDVAAPVETEVVPEPTQAPELTKQEIDDEEARLDAMLESVMNQPQIEVPVETPAAPAEVTPSAPVEEEPKVEEPVSAPVETPAPAPVEAPASESAPAPIDNISVQVDEINLPTEAISVSDISTALEKEGEEDILSAISKATEETSATALSTEEKIAIVADSIPKNEVTVDPVKEAKIAKYNGVSLDPAIYDFKIKDDEEQEVVVDGKNYTVIDYLEDNKVLEFVPLDSRVYLKDDSKDDSVDGRTFIREYVIPNACNGNMSIDSILDYYAQRIVKADEIETKKKGLFGFMKK